MSGFLQPSIQNENPKLTPGIKAWKCLWHISAPIAEIFNKSINFPVLDGTQVVEEKNE